MSSYDGYDSYDSYDYDPYDDPYDYDPYGDPYGDEYDPYDYDPYGDPYGEDSYWDPYGDDNYYKEPTVEEIIESVMNATDTNGDQEISKMEFKKYIKGEIGARIKEERRVHKQIVEHLKSWRKALWKIWKVLADDKKVVTKQDLEDHIDDVKELMKEYYGH